jgi:hypothetical protein
VPDATTGQRIESVERLVHESVGRVDALTPSAMHSVLPALRQARDELQRDLAKWLHDHPDGAETFTAFQKKRALMALESAFERIDELAPAMGGALAHVRHATGGIAVSNLGDEVARLSSLFGGGTVSVPQIDTAAVIAEGNRLLWKRHENSARRYAGSLGDDIRTRLSVSLAKGDTFEQMQRRLVGSPEFRAMVAKDDPGAAAFTIAEAAHARWRHWADRLVRTESMHAYNTQHDVAIVYANENRPDDDEPYLRRWDASADKVTCERCKELDRTVTTIEGVFRYGYQDAAAAPVLPLRRARVARPVGQHQGRGPKQGRAR